MSDQKPLNSQTPAEKPVPVTGVTGAPNPKLDPGVTFTPNDSFEPPPPLVEEKVEDEVNLPEQVLDVDSELKGGGLDDTQLKVVQPLARRPLAPEVPAVPTPAVAVVQPLPAVPPILATPAAPLPPAPTPVLVTPPQQVPTPQTPPPPPTPFTAPAPVVPANFVPKAPEVPVAEVPQKAPGTPPPKPINDGSSIPTINPELNPPKPATPTPQKPAVPEVRSFASMTPLVMRPAVTPNSSAPQITPKPPTPSAPAQKTSTATVPPTPSEPLAPGTVTKQPIIAEVRNPSAEDSPRKLTVLEQLREQADSVLHPLRTYQMDARGRIKDDNVSMITVAAAEENRKAAAQSIPKPASEEFKASVTPVKRETPQEIPKPPSPIERTISRPAPVLTSAPPSQLVQTPQRAVSDAPKHHYLRTTLVVLGMVLLLAGGGGAIAFVLTPKTVEPPTEPVLINHPITVDESVELQFGGLDHDALMRLLSDMRDKTSLSLGLVREIYFTLPADKEKKRLATVSEVLPRLAPHVPPELLRTLDSSFLVGVHVFDGNQGFLVLRTKEFEQASAAMIGWESTMRADFLPFMDRRPPEKLRSDTTSTTTQPHVIDSQFVDVVLKNHDTRVLYDNLGNIVFLYSFIDRNTIFIGTNESTLGEAVERLNSN